MLPACLPPSLTSRACHLLPLALASLTLATQTIRWPVASLSFSTQTIQHSHDTSSLPRPHLLLMHHGSKLALAGQAHEEEEGAHAKHGCQREGAHLQRRRRGRQERRQEVGRWLWVCMCGCCAAYGVGS